MYKFIFQTLGLPQMASLKCGENAEVRAQREANDANLRMNRETNEANLRIAREANDINASQFARQIEENWRMFDATNEYNSPAQNLKRLQNAGINGRLALLNGVANIGNASAMSTPDPKAAEVATMQAGHVEPISYLPVDQAIVNSLNVASDIAFKGEQIRSAQIDNANKEMDWRMKFADTQSRIAQQLSSSHLSQAEQRNLRWTYDFNSRVADDMAHQQKFNWMESEQRINLMREQALTNAAERGNIAFNQWLAKEHLAIDKANSKALLSQCYKQIEALAADINVKDAEVQKKVAETCHEWLKAQGTIISNSRAAEMADVIIRNYDANIDYMGWKSVNESLDARYPKVFRGFGTVDVLNGTYDTNPPVLNNRYKRAKGTSRW